MAALQAVASPDTTHESRAAHRRAIGSFPQFSSSELRTDGDFVRGSYSPPGEDLQPYVTVICTATTGGGSYARPGDDTGVFGTFASIRCAPERACFRAAACLSCAVPA